MNNPNLNELRINYNPNYQNYNNINRSNTSPYNIYNPNILNQLSNDYENNIYQRNSSSSNNLIYNIPQQRPMSSYQQMRYNNNVESISFLGAIGNFHHKRISEEDVMRSKKKLQQKQLKHDLDQQIQEKKIMKELEKKRRIEEELKLEEKLQKEREEKKKKEELEKQRELMAFKNKNINESNQEIHHNLYTTSPNINMPNNTNISNFNQGYQTQFQNMNYNMLNNQDMNYNMNNNQDVNYNMINNQDVNYNMINNQDVNYNMINNQEMNYNMLNNQEMNYNMNNNQEMNYNMNNNQDMNYNNNFKESAHFGINNNNMNQNNQFIQSQLSNQYNNQQINQNYQQQLLNEQAYQQRLIEEKFIKDCMNLMTQYENNMENFKISPSNRNNKQENIKKALMSERDAISEKFKTYQQNYQNKINISNVNSNKFDEYLNAVLEQKIKELEKSNSEPKKKINYEINNNKNNNSQNNNLENKESNNLKNNNPFISSINKNLVDCGYKSKYEEIRKSVFSDDNKENPELDGWSKLVVTKKQVSNDKSFYTTWRDNSNSTNINNNNISNINNINNNNLNNNIKNSNIDKKSSNEIVYNIPNEEFLMPNKISDNNYNESNEDDRNLTNKDNNTTNKSKMIDRFENVKNLKISKDDQNISVNFIDNKLNKNIDSKSNNEKNIFEEFERNNLNKEYENNNNNNINITQNIMDSKSISYMKTNTNNNYNYNNNNNNDNYRDDNTNNNNNYYNITDDDILNDELDEDNCNYKIGNSSYISDNNINTEKKEIKKEESEEEENYENDFETDKVTLKNIIEGEKNQDNNVNLDDYKEIHESQQLENQLNFFESNNNIENINIRKSKYQKNTPKNETNIKNSLMISNSINDSYGDNIINDLNKFRRLALEESTISNYYKK